MLCSMVNTSPERPTELSSCPVPSDGHFSDERHVERDVRLYVSESDWGVGTLYVLESQTIWWSEEISKGYALPYPSIVMHAICRDLTTFTKPCIYCHLEADVIGDGNPDEELSEMRFVPSSESALDGIFAALSSCQELHPDPMGSDDEDEPILDPEMVEARQHEFTERVFNMPSAEEFIRLANEGGDISTSYEDGQFEDARDDNYAEEEEEEEEE